MNDLCANPTLSVIGLEARLQISKSLCLTLGLLAMLLAVTGIAVIELGAASLTMNVDAGHDADDSGLDCPVDAAGGEHTDQAHCASASPSCLTAQFVMDVPDGARFSLAPDNISDLHVNGRLKRPPRLA